MDTRCGARTGAGGHCLSRPMRGQIRCYKHGGASPQARASADVRYLEQQVRRLVPATVGPMEDPIRALLTVAAEAEAFKDALRSLVGDLNAKIRYRTDGGEQLRAEVVVYERALDRVGRMCVDIAKLNLDERLVRIAEDQAARVLKAMDGALAEAGLDVDMQAEVKRATARHLRAVA